MIYTLNTTAGGTMASMRFFQVLSLSVVLFCLAPPASGDTYQLILQGKVMMADGSPPPKTVGIERICSDVQGSAPGPITDKKGSYLWRMEVDPLRTRACVLRARLAGYTSSEIDISGFNSYTNPVLPPLVLTPREGDANTISVSDNEVPSKARPAWKAAMKALDTHNMPEAARQIQAAVAAVPKFAQGWNALGAILEKQNRMPEARDAFAHAVEADPKLLPSYVGLARTDIATKDWQDAAKTADALIKVDTNRVYTEIYLHQAVAKYQLKDLDGAAAAAQQMLALDPNRKKVRTEYVLGRILEAKGDLSGAREHMSSYLAMDPGAPDLAQVRAHFESLGKPEAASVDPDLEVLP